MTLLTIRVINNNMRRVHEMPGDVALKTLGSAQRRTLSKVTFGIWAVTHSSAGERLGYMLLWKCTSCVITLYSRLNGVHPHPVFSQHVTSHLWVRPGVRAPRPHGLRVRTRRDPVNANSVLYVHVCAPCRGNAGLRESVCESVSIITPRTPRACVSEEPWSQGTPHVSARRIRQQQISDDSEAQWK